ncbi:MAG: menaquinone biosynthesis decarboxylase [bacterium]
MAYNDLRHFIEVLERKNLIKKIKTEVDPVLEITEISDRSVKTNGPALFFEKVKNSNFPVVTNLFASYERMNLALETENFDEIANKIKSLLQIPNVSFSLENKIKLLFQLKNFSSYFPKIIKNALCQEIILKDPDLSILPILKCWPEDGGKFITLPLVFTKDPKTKIRNVGMYRMQVFDKNTTGMHWHIHKDGADHLRACSQNEKLDVAVVIGTDPAMIYAATAPLPKNFDEVIFAGFLRNKKIELVKCKTIDMEVPANSEFVLEGYVLPEEKKEEGPFGDHTGFYSNKDLYSVFHLTCITHRKNAIYSSTIVGRPPMEDCFMAKATERIFLPLIQFIFPEIKDINFPIEGVFHNCIIVSIKKTYPGQGKKIIHSIWGLGQLMNSKFVIVLEDDTDIQNLKEVAWKVFNNVDPSRDLIISGGPLDALDHSSSWTSYGAKMGIDATRKTKEEGMLKNWPNEIKMTEKIKNLVNEKWKEYGL